MRKESILVNTQGIRGGKMHSNKQGYVAISCTPGFNEKQDRIVIDGFKGLGNNYEQRGVPLLSIQFKSGLEWSGTLAELEMKIKGIELDPVTPVKFLIGPDADLFAYFPEMVHNGENMTCYAHVGQHSACHPNYAAEATEAYREQYNDLLQELIGQGYNNLKILNAE